MPVERNKFFQEKNNIEIVEKKKQSVKVCMEVVTAYTTGKKELNRAPVAFELYKLKNLPLWLIRTNYIGHLTHFLQVQMPLNI